MIIVSNMYALICVENDLIYIYEHALVCVYRETSHIHVCIMIYMEHKADKMQDYKNLLLSEVLTHYTLKSIMID